MISNQWTYLISLLRLALEADALPIPHQPLSPDGWREVHRLAAKHAVIAVAWDGVERLQSQAPEMLKTLPADLMGKWFADSRSIEAANSRLANQAAQVLALLKSGEFDACILKGASLAAYYPQPSHRQSADIDLWVFPKVTSQPLAVHRQALLAFLRRQPDISLGEIVYHHIETEYNGTEVEFHVTPTWLCNPVHNRRLQYIFAQARALTPELQELYTLFHAFRHIYHDGVALRHVMDYYLVRRSNRAAGIPSPVALCQQVGLTTFAQAMDEVADYYFGSPVSADMLSPRARHLLQVLPERRTSRAIRCDYMRESLFSLPWRTLHYLWRKKNHYV